MSEDVSVLQTAEEIRAHILDIYSKNHFMSDYFHIKITDIIAAVRPSA